jgi:hypothetical protein
MDNGLMQTLNLRKEQVLDLKKKLNITAEKAQVVLCLDYSQSMAYMYRDGIVQTTVERVLPLGLGFDDNGEVDFYIFDNGVRRITTPVSMGNVQGYIKSVLYRNGSLIYDMGGTNYAPAIKQIQQDFVQFSSGSTGFLKKLFNRESKTATPAMPVYVIFITDGQNSDVRETEAAIIEASNYGIFFQFIGIGPSRFPQLEALDTMSGRFIDNANFFSAADLARIDDAELYRRMLVEYPSWVNLARQKGIIL